MQVNSGKTSPPRLVRPPTRSLTAAAVTGPVALVVDAVVPVPPVSLVLVTAVVASELEADGAELTVADPVAEGPVLGVCPELAEVPEELKADEVPEVWVPEAEVTDAEPEAPDDEDADSEEADSEAEDELEEEVDSGAEDELEREELPDGEMMLVD